MVRCHLLPDLLFLARCTDSPECLFRDGPVSQTFLPVTRSCCRFSATLSE
jgi:hypothetical protein